jgi:hypothetical protein
MPTVLKVLSATHRIFVPRAAIPSTFTSQPEADYIEASIVTCFQIHVTQVRSSVTAAV